MDALTETESAEAGNLHRMYVDCTIAQIRARQMTRPNSLGGGGCQVRNRRHLGATPALSKIAQALEYWLGDTVFACKDMVPDDAFFDRLVVTGVGRADSLSPGTLIRLPLTDGEQFTCDGVQLNLDQFWNFTGDVMLKGATYLIEVLVWIEASGETKFCVQRLKVSSAVKDATHFMEMISLFLETFPGVVNLMRMHQDGQEDRSMKSLRLATGAASDLSPDREVVTA